MKKIITGLILLYSSLILAQDINPIPNKLLLEGIWRANETSYTCIITVNEEFSWVETIHNVSFEEDLILIEKILNQNSAQVVTTHTNELNGHTVTSVYKLIDENHMLRKFTGDVNIDVLYTRAYKN